MGSIGIVRESSMDLCRDPTEENYEGMQGSPMAIAKHRNKLAQQLYRKRQRAKKDSLVNQIAALEKRLAHLKTTHDNLQTRNQSLEELADKLKSRTGAFPAITDLEESVGIPIEAQRKLIGNWNVCFAEYDNAIRRYASPLMLPGHTLGHNMNPHALQQMKLDIAHELSNICKKASSPRDMQREMEEYIIDVRNKKQQVMQCYCSFKAMCLGTKMPHAGAQMYDSEVSALVSTMKLTNEQVSALLTAKQSFEANIEEIANQRTRILQSFREHDRQQKESCDHPNQELEALDSIAESTLKLQKNLSMEGLCMYHLALACNQIISPIQEAVASLEGLRKGAWFELWDTPSILRQIQLQSVSQHRAQGEPPARNEGMEPGPSSEEPRDLPDGMHHPIGITSSASKESDSSTQSALDSIGLDQQPGSFTGTQNGPNSSHGLQNGIYNQNAETGPWSLQDT